MNKIWFSLIIALLMVLGGVYLKYLYDEPEETTPALDLERLDLPEIGTPQNAITEAPAEQSEQTIVVTTTNQTANGWRNRQEWVEHGCKDVPCSIADSQNPFLATSLEEAIWLKQNGYPTRRQLEIAEEMDGKTLLEFAKAENSPAVYAMAYEKLLLESDIQQGRGQYGLELSLLAKNTGSPFPVVIAGRSEIARATQRVKGREPVSIESNELARVGGEYTTALKHLAKASLLGDRRAFEVLKLIPMNLRYSIDNTSLAVHFDQASLELQRTQAGRGWNLRYGQNGLRPFSKEDINKGVVHKDQLEAAPKN